MSRLPRLVPSLVVLALVSSASVANAGPIVTVNPTGPWPNGAGPGGTDLYIFNIDPDGTVFDTIDITFEARPGGFLGENVPALTEFSPAGTGANTDVLGLNTVAIGWSILVGADTPTFFNAAGGPLGQDILAPVDFAQIVASPGTSWSALVNFANDGVLVDSQFIVTPEPSAALIALMGFCYVGIRRR